MARNSYLLSLRAEQEAASTNSDIVRLAVGASRLSSAITMRSVTRRFNIGASKIVAFEQQRFPGDLRQGVGKAIAEIKPCWMATSLTEIAICLSRNSNLRFGDRLNNYLSLFDQIIEAPAGDRIAACVYDECSFDKIAG